MCVAVPVQKTSDLSGHEWKWGNGKHVIDMLVYSRNRVIQLPRCSKDCLAPFLRISGDPFDQNDDFTSEFNEHDSDAWGPFAISNPVTDSRTIMVPDLVPSARSET
jgi:hypothetical protein